MKDKQAVVWTRLGGQPRLMGQLVLTEQECRFTYDTDYLHSGLPGLGLILSPAFFASNTIVRSRSEWFDYLPPIQALVPPRDSHNFQRQLTLNYLARKGQQPESRLEADWLILTTTGHGGIGHLDLFETSERAREWYSQPMEHTFFEIGDDFGFSLKKFMTWFDADADMLINLLGPTPSVGGAIPKLLLSMPRTGWDGRIGLPTRGAVQGVTDIILKMENAVNYPGLLELEALSLRLYRDAGFRVPRFWESAINDIPVLAVERFDRDERQQPLFTESLYSVLASGDHSITNNHSYSYDAIGNAIDRSPIAFAGDHKAAKETVFTRLLMALLTGNGDLHLENLSLMLSDHQPGFTPVYDPTPMRAYSLHNLLVPMPFGGYGDIDAKTGDPVKLPQAIENLAQHFRIQAPRRKQLIEQALAWTKDYPQMVDGLQRLPGDNKQRLIKVAGNVRQKISAM